MILGRIAGQLREQNWGAVLVEFVVITVGIFAGLQADQWKDDRADMKRANAHLQQLHEDFGFNVKVARNMSEHHAERGADLRWAIGVVKRGALADDEEERFKWAILRMLQYSRSGMTTGGYDTIVSSGDLSLIGDQELKSRMVRLHAMLATERDRLSELSSVDLDIAESGQVTYAVPHPSGRGVEWKVDFELLLRQRGSLAVLANQARNHEMMSVGFAAGATEFQALQERVGTLLGINEAGGP